MQRFVLLSAVAIGAFGCSESDFQEDVAGIARLSILQVALLANEVVDDDRCGFEAQPVKDAVTIEGAYAQRGRVVYRVEDCALGFDAVEKVLDNCGRDSVRLSGRARVTGSMVVEGIISDDDDDPIIPAGPDAVTIVLERVVLEGFRAKFDETNAELIMREGSLSAEVRPRLARAKDTSFCSIPTGDAEVRNLRYDGASLLARDGGEALVFVSSSDLRGQIGLGERSENTFAGEITIGGQLVELPQGDTPGFLDEDYERADFESQFTCEDGLRLPLDYACACVGNECHPDAPVADGVARLLPQVFGNIVGLLEDDETCGFAADRTPTYDGEVGDHGVATYTIETACRLRFSTPYQRDIDCNGVASFIAGEARVTGTKSVRGYLTGDLDGDAVVPTAMDAVTYDLTIEALGLDVTTSSDTPSMRIDTGVLTGAMRPLFALHAEDGACSEATGFGVFEGLDLRNGQVVIADPNDGDERTHELLVERSAVTAVAGRFGGIENDLLGTVSTGGELFEVPTDGGGLDPNYDLASATAAFTCEPQLVWPTTPALCSFSQELGPDIARAAVGLMATAITRIADDDTCGLRSGSAAVSTTADVGQEGTVTSSVTNCVLTEASTNAVADDCHRKKTYAEGTVAMSGVRVARGRIIRDAGHTTVDPLARDAYLDDFELTFRGYRTWTLERDTETPVVDASFENGTGAIVMMPILGENEETGLFDIPTPIARISAAAIRNVDALVGSYGRNFRVHIDEAQLEVSSGIYEGRGNEIVGFIVLDGERIDLAPGTPLDEDYEQQTFDFSYSCAPDLKEPVPPN